MRPAVFAVTIAAGLVVSCEAICACTFPAFSEIVYGRVESATGTGIPTAVVLSRLALDTVCVFDDQAQQSEIDVGAEGRFRAAIHSFENPKRECLELQAFDPAVGEPDTVFFLTVVDFADPDSTGVVLRLP